jgi:outer membrane protein TolC
MPYARKDRGLLRPLIALGGALLLSACQTFSADRGMNDVVAIAGPALDKNVGAVRTAEDAVAARTAIEYLLKRPLTADAAVQIALLNNRNLQAAYNELGFAEASAVGASLPPNPTFSVSRLSGGIETEIEKRIVLDILALATLPARADIARDRFRQAQLQAALETLRVAAETRRAYYRAVAARELSNFLAQAQSAAEAATRIAKQLGETGSLNKLDQAREQVFYAEITAQLAAARQRMLTMRELLVRQLGLFGDDLDFRLPNALPPLPRSVPALPAVEAEAVRRRVDLQIARLDAIALAKSYGLTQATRFVSLLDAGAAKKTTHEEGSPTIRERGIEVEFQIPLFDFGEVRVRQAEQTYMQSVNLLLAKAVNVRSEARDAYRTYRSSYDIARHYEREVLPLRKIISEEMQLRYGAMQIDVFSLLLDARQRINSTIAAVEAKRDFWLAATDFQSVVIGGSTAPQMSQSSASGPAASSGSPGH